MKKLLCSVLIMVMLLTSLSGFAMSTYNFDRGMAKGISYFNRGMYYEARDEFQWFCDYNWGAMNYGQQQYALDYLDGAKAKIWEWENRVIIDNFYFNLLGKTRAQVDKIVGPIVESSWDEGPIYKHKSTGNVWFSYNDTIYRNDGSSHAPSNAICTSISTTANNIISMNNWNYNTLNRLKRSFDIYYGRYFMGMDSVYYHKFKHNNHELYLYESDYTSTITPYSRIWIFK